MIKAIFNHKDKTAVVEFPMDLYNLYQSLHDIGFNGGPHRVKLHALYSIHLFLRVSNRRIERI